MKGFLGRWLPPLVWMGLIFLTSAQPTLPSVPAWWDVLLKKGMHVAAYGILTWLTLRALRGSWDDDRKVRAVSVFLAVAYAWSDEYHQTFVPGRNGSWVDVLIDGGGILAAILLDRCRVAQRCWWSSQVSE